MKMPKRISLFIIFASLLLFFGGGIIFSGSAAAKSGKPVVIKLATATKGGTFYPVGVALSELWNKELEKRLPYAVKVSALLSAGSKENITLLRGKKAEMAILQGLFGSLAWNAGTKKKKPYRDFRAVSMLWPNVEHFVMLRNKVRTGTILDIKGTRFSIGRPLSGTEKSTLIIMRAVGIGKKDILPEHFGYKKAADAIKKGKLEGASLVAGPPVPAVRDLYTSLKTEIAVLEFTDKQLKQITGHSVYPGFRYIIPPGTYPGQEKEIRTIAQPTFLAVRDDVDEELVYQMTKAVYENLDFLGKKHPVTRSMSIESAVSGLPIPLHPGALRYYREAGLEIPEEIILK